MRDLLKNTADMYEKKYGEEICQPLRFARYREFWNKYIGQRKDNPLKHYEIDSSTKHIKEFDDKYEKMVLAHYGIFVDLVGIRIDYELLSNNKYNTPEDIMKYWNTVRNIYTKMGDCLYKYEHFLSYVKDIFNIGKLLEDVLKNINEDMELITHKRNFMVHFTCIPFIDGPTFGKRLPRRIYDEDKRKFLSYSEIMKQDLKYWIPVQEGIEDDLAELERKLNYYQSGVLKNLDKYKKFKIIDPDSISNTSSLSSASSNAIDLPKSSGDTPQI